MLRDEEEERGTLRVEDEVSMVKVMKDRGRSWVRTSPVPILSNSNPSQFPDITSVLALNLFIAPWSVWQFCFVS